MRTEFLCISVIRVASGPRVKLASCKSALNLGWFTLLTVLWRWSRCWSYFLLLCGLFYEAICYMSYLVLFYSCVFSPFSIAITSLGEERANLSTFRTFVRFALVWFCLFPLLLGRAAASDCGIPWTFLLPFLDKASIFSEFRF